MLGSPLRGGQFSQVTVFADLDNTDAEVLREKRPRRSPSPALLEATKSENGLLAVSPAYARALQPLGGERLARRFDVSTIIRSSRQLFSRSGDMIDLLSKDYALVKQDASAAWES
jgi:hypothetical protein